MNSSTEVSLEKCPCCGLPEHMLIKPTKKVLRYHAYCPYCKFTAFLLKVHVRNLREKSQKQNKALDYMSIDETLFDATNFEFDDELCFICFRNLPVKKCKSKRRRTVCISCSDCSYRLFIPVLFFCAFSRC